MRIPRAIAPVLLNEEAPTFTGAPLPNYFLDFFLPFFFAFFAFFAMTALRCWCRQIRIIAAVAGGH